MSENVNIETKVQVTTVLVMLTLSGNEVNSTWELMQILNKIECRFTIIDVNFFP